MWSVPTSRLSGVGKRFADVGKYVEEIEMVDQPIVSSDIGESMGGLCWTVSGIALMEAANRKFVHRYGWPVMATPNTAGGGLTIGGPP